MAEISAFDAKTHFSRYLARARAGEEFVITHRGEPVAKLVPLKAKHDSEAAKAAFERMRARAKALPQPFTTDEILDLIAEGRNRR